MCLMVRLTTDLGGLRARRHGLSRASHLVCSYVSSTQTLLVSNHYFTLCCSVEMQIETLFVRTRPTE